MINDSSSRAPRAIPNVLTIAGVDPSGGAGVLADIKAMSALGAYGCGVVAALTAQNTQGVTGVMPVPPAFVRQQIETLFADVRIDAVKLGMLGQAPVIETVADSLVRHIPPHLVLDPVMIAKSGDALLEDDAVGTLREAILPIATVITPNLPEAGVLLGGRQVETLPEMRRVAERLREAMGTHGHRWVLLKGGHLPGDAAIDLLHDGDRMIEMAAPRVDTKNTHGTGCSLASALAALLPQAPDVPAAARAAKDYLTQALKHADRLQVGSGHGPLQHFWRWW
ncbi:bifunctional hydroxymethylpyrimidine kinase/phosphomethylpyrimidine kinase [Verticiella sediminum]|uniref:hydroxymethylpyrimidine kinase n=1 Tax=Verticiella sediminum TaxID=1247510 RepID=A0A556A7W3_9BURK|nr:bifunctional hydroxymethylpyrimidine kinase/phosphomethylpyrimidine kinase [Verticiella sediminum]TSH88965.1 bifunctional hydroxymethylpyrimidine kinase/phosphomethylpyrimidine kinase [Verticiella sediminum]